MDKKSMVLLSLVFVGACALSFYVGSVSKNSVSLNLPTPSFDSKGQSSVDGVRLDTNYYGYREDSNGNILGFYFLNQKDGSQVTLADTEARLILNADGESVEYVNPHIPDNRFFEWGISKYGVYFRGILIKNLDPKTFAIINPGLYTECGHLPYIKDRNGIYTSPSYRFDFADPSTYIFEKIVDADAASFEFLGGPYSRDKNYLYEGIKRTDLDPKDANNYDTHCG